MKKFNLSTDRMIGLSAMMISLLTLIIFIYQTNLMREQSRLSVTPRISFNSNQKQVDSIIHISSEIVNKGLGPAIIESINIVHEGQSYDLDFPDFLEKVFPEVEEYGNLASNTSLSKGSTLAANEKITLYTFTLPIANIRALMQYLNMTQEEDPFTIEVIYSSIYNEQWKVQNHQKGHPTKL